MRRAEAPGYQPAVAGGGKEKARIGCVPEKNTDTGRGGRCSARFAPVAQWIERRFRSPEMSVQFWPGAFVQWVPECVNTQEPATEARLRGNDCTGKGNRIITFLRALSKEPAVNTLSQEKQTQVLSMLVEGASIR